MEYRFYNIVIILIYYRGQVCVKQFIYMFQTSSVYLLHFTIKLLKHHIPGRVL